MITRWRRQTFGIELAKLCYFTFIGAYSVPRRYAFVAPRGVGTKLMRLLKKPTELQAGLLAVWDEKCAERPRRKTNRRPLRTISGGTSRPSISACSVMCRLWN